MPDPEAAVIPAYNVWRAVMSAGGAAITERPMRISALALLALLAGGLTASRTTAQPAPAPTLGFPLACRIGVSCEVQHYVDRDPGPEVK